MIILTTIQGHHLYKSCYRMATKICENNSRIFHKNFSFDQEQITINAAHSPQEYNTNSK